MHQVIELRIPRLVIAGSTSGVGKTSITSAIIYGLKKRGYTIKGDVDFDSVSKKVKFLTPVPGGVGPMTIAMLLQNTLDARLSTLQ